jgi:hypothetical protein
MINHLKQRGIRHRSLSPEIKSLTCVNATPIAKYVISAEFDNHVGAQVKHQIPRKIPGFKENLGALAELMIPSNSEHSPESYSVFVLYKDVSNKYRLLPDTDRDTIEETQIGFQNMHINSINTIFEKESHDDDTLFFFNVTRSIESPENPRGRTIRSIAVGTPLRNFILLKHIITATIFLYSQDPQMGHLIALFNVVNSTDISLWRNYLTANPFLYNILSLNYEFGNSIILAHFKNIQSKDVTSQSIQYKKGVLQYYSNYDISSFPQDSILTKIPFNFSLCSHPTDIITDINVSEAILRFLNSLSTNLNRVNYKNFKIIIHSSQRTDFLTSFILTLSNFLNGFQKSHFHNDQILYFPLIELYNWEQLLDFDRHTKNTKIIGTNNAILKEYSDFYDFYYDLDSFEMSISPELEQHNQVSSKTHDFIELTESLLIEKHDYTTVKISFHRSNIYEIIKILNREDSDQAELNLRDYYLSKNKNIVIFEEFFEFKTITLIDTLHKLTEIFSNEFFTLEDIDGLNGYYDFIIGYVTTAVKGRLEMFLYLLEIFPVDITSPKDLVYDADLETCDGLLNAVFRPIIFRNVELQSKVLKLYHLLKHCPLSMILENRLNPFLSVMLEEKS